MVSGGYRWWYLDGLSDDGEHALTLIAFIGSVFSPYYKRARKHGSSEPLDHSAINLALYGKSGHRWAMTERRRGSVLRAPDVLAIGRSELRWNGQSLIIDLDERTVPWPSRIRGRLRLHPRALSGHVETLAASGHHVWTPIAPSARIEVELDSPKLSWSGEAYLDGNAGDTPIEDAFRSWHWSRNPLRDGSAVLYDVARRDGSALNLALRFDGHGEVSRFEPPPAVVLPKTGWRIDRASRGEGGAAAIVQTLEDTPFYARSLLSTTLCGERTTGVHESLDLDRFRQPVVQWMLPFRMPRARH
ncbi:carotenoid 1,2-hydratase [Nevskia ramosa]|uniref:carotenoid 1,2-hydratase n=1 Tax=Nevskia ramosa TaxID=64002 RepID=UPI003D0F11C3